MNARREIDSKRIGGCLQSLRWIVAFRLLAGLGMTVVDSGRAAFPLDYQGRPFDDAAYRAEQRANEDRPALPFRAFGDVLKVWSGRTSTNGFAWVRGGEQGAFARLDEPDADSVRLIHFHAATANYRYVAFGWNWATPLEPGVDLAGYGAVSFSLKVVGPKKMQELFFSVTGDQPAPVSLRPFQPSFADGAWHRVIIPAQVMKWAGSAAAKSEVRGFALSTFVWNASDFDIYLDQLAFERLANPGAVAAIPPVYKAGAARGQAIPGRIECAFYDLGGEGISYHDTTPINILSAVLNQQAIHQRPHATPYHWNFRREEGVDISFVKDFADLNHTNRTDPPVNQLYIGGTEDGEWCNYTVNVRKAGDYKIIAAYGNVAGAKPLRFEVDGQPAAECPCPKVTTGMHQWTREEIGRITFRKGGVHLLTLRYERGYNLGYLDFEKIK